MKMELYSDGPSFCGLNDKLPKELASILNNFNYYRTPIIVSSGDKILLEGVTYLGRIDLIPSARLKRVLEHCDECKCGGTFIVSPRGESRGQYETRAYQIELFAMRGNTISIEFVPLPDGTMFVPMRSEDIWDLD